MRYYTQCLFTPDETNDLRFPPYGFLFHDTEAKLEVTSLLKPIRRLYDLCHQPTNAILIRRDNRTIAVTFSTAGFPTPTTIWKGLHRSEYLQQTNLRGWILKDPSDPGSLQSVNYSDLYDRCTRLERFTDDCPCALKRSGECFSTNAAPIVGDLHDTHFSYIDSSVLKRNTYKELFDFNFVPPAYVTDELFQGELTWNDADFSLVEENAAWYSKKGERQRLRNEHIKQHCGQCTFSGTFDMKKHCGHVDRCKEHVTENTLMTALYTWYEHRSRFDEMEGFTKTERNYLIARSRDVVRSNAISKRNIPMHLAGFFKVGRDWKFKLTANKGDPSRTTTVSSYKELLEVAPELPTTPENISLSSHQLMMTAGAGQHNYVHLPYYGRREKTRIISMPTQIEIITANTRMDFPVDSIAADSPAREIFRVCFGYDFPNALHKLRNNY